MGLEALLLFGSVFTFGAKEGRTFAAFVPQVVTQALLVLVKPITLVTLKWHDWPISWAC